MACPKCKLKATGDVVDRCTKENCPYVNQKELGREVNDILAIPGHTHQGVIDDPDPID